MHDIRFIRESPQAFDAGLKKRNLAPLSAEILEVDRRRRAAISESEAIQARRKALSQQIGMAKRKGEPAEALMAEVSMPETSKLLVKELVERSRQRYLPSSSLSSFSLLCCAVMVRTSP